MAQLPQRSSSRPPKPSKPYPAPQSGEQAAVISTEVPTMLADSGSRPVADDGGHTTRVGTGASFGSYRLESLIGRGGMASVYAAHRHDESGRATADKRRVAIKILQPDLLDDPTAMPRFMREGRMASTLKSAHSVRVLDVGLSNGLPFMVMELLEGESLASFLASAPKGRVSPQIALDLLSQTCSAVAEAHEAGIIHRDLTPGNLFLVKDDQNRLCVKVLDFGLAKPSYKPEADPTAISITQAGSCLGTPRYMAPEQILGARDVDARVDVWALGICLYTMMTGHHPFEGDDKNANASTIPMRVLAAKPTPPRTHRTDISPAVEQIIMRCLAAKPADRYLNARELETAIRSQLLTRPSTPPSGRPSPIPSAPPPPKHPSKTRLIANRPVPADEEQPTPSLGLLVNTTTGEPPLSASLSPGDEFQEGTLVMPAALARVRPTHQRASNSAPPPPPASNPPPPMGAQMQTAPQPMRPVQYSPSAPPPPPSAPVSAYPSSSSNARQRSQPTVRVRRRANHHATTVVLSLFLLFILCAAVAFVWTRRGEPNRAPSTTTSTTRR